MEGFSILQILKFILTMASFGGLCLFVKEKFRLDAAIAPLATTCGIMILLVLSGIIGILSPAWHALFIGGLALGCFSLVNGRKAARAGKEWLPMIVLSAALVYVLWRFSGQYYMGNDSFSHWGVAAKYLVRKDCFPDRSTNVIHFQSYPMGTTCFLYYMIRLSGWSEGLSLCAFFMMNVIAFLPVMSAAKKHHALGYVLTALVFLFIISYGVPVNQVQVDTVMGLMAAGSIASVYCYRNDEKRMTALAMLFSAMFVLVKSSGVFFGAIICAYTAVIVYHKTGKKAYALRAAMLPVLAIIAAYAVWNIHVKTAFDSGLDTRHAVSISNFAKELQNKQAGIILAIAAKMLIRLVKPQMLYIALTAAAVLFVAGMYIMIRRRPEEKDVWVKKLKYTVWMCVAIYAVWYLMLFFMYVFSMPGNSAVELASITRYERTVHAFIIGIMWLFALEYFFREDFHFDLPNKKVRVFVKTAGIALLVAGIAFVGSVYARELFQKLENYGENQFVMHFRDNYDIEEEARYIVLFDDSERDIKYVNRVVKHEFLSSGMLLLCHGIEKWELDPEAYYAFWNITANGTDHGKVESIQEMLEEKAAEYDYILVLDRNPDFESAIEAFRENYPDARVAYGYK